MIGNFIIHIAELEKCSATATSTISSNVTKFVLHELNAKLQGLYLKKLYCQKELHTIAIFTEDKNR